MVEVVEGGDWMYVLEVGEVWCRKWSEKHGAWGSNANIPYGRRDAAAMASRPRYARLELSGAATTQNFERRGGCRRTKVITKRAYRSSAKESRRSRERHGRASAAGKTRLKREGPKDTKCVAD